MALPVSRCGISGVSPPYDSLDANCALGVAGCDTTSSALGMAALGALELLAADLVTAIIFDLIQCRIDSAE